MATTEQIALHGHWFRATAIEYVVNASERISGDTQNWPKEVRGLASAVSAMGRLEVFYALLYVVIEGYRELGYKYASIDALLEREDYVDQLRRFRNAIFHFQKEPFNQKLLGFLSAKDSEHWVRDLFREFGRFFDETFPGKELMRKWNNRGE